MATEWLSTSIVHDLRNPLTTIYAAAEMLVDLDPGPSQVKRLATNIYRAAGRMQELVADLNSAAREETVTAEMCDIRKVITAASDAAMTDTENSRVRIVLGVPEGIELPLVRRQMERVFFNLITNALQAMPAGGQIGIGARKAGHIVLIEVEDTGPGIPHAFASGCSNRLLQQANPTASGLAWPSPAKLFATTAATFKLSPPPVLVLLSASAESAHRRLTMAG